MLKYAEFNFPFARAMALVWQSFVVLDGQYTLNLLTLSSSAAVAPFTNMD